MPRLSIIIPHLDCDHDLESTILSVLENRPIGTEIIVAHSGSYTDPYDLGEDEVEMLNVGEGAIITELLNAGLSRCRGEIVETLLPGCKVLPGWTEAALGHFLDPHVATVSPRVIASDCKEKQFLGLDYRWMPRRSWLHRGGAGEDVISTLCGGFYRRSHLVSTSGWLGTAEISVARETAEAELGLIFLALDLDTVSECESVVYAPRRVIEGKVGGYHLGHDAGRLAMAFAGVPEIASHHETLASKLGHLAGGLISPTSVAERLGWVLGSTDRSLVADIRWRLERAKMELASRTLTIEPMLHYKAAA